MTDISASTAPNGDVWDNIKLTQDSSNVKQDYSEEDYSVPPCCCSLRRQSIMCFSSTAATGIFASLVLVVPL